MNTPWNIIKELEADNSRLTKESIVLREANANNDEFFKGCRWALDSMVTFGVKSMMPKKDKDDGKGALASTFWDLADKLSKRELTGHAALFAVNHFRMNAKADEWNNWYLRILTKDLKCGVSEKTINKMVEKINDNYSIPVFTCQLAHDGANHESKVVGKKLVEVKLDGVRVITIVYPNGTCNMFSRNGKELVNFPHIKDQFTKHAKLLKVPTVFDGEVMSSSFQDLMKQVHRKENVEANDAILHLFDILTLDEFKTGISNTSQQDRSVMLNIWFDPIKEHMPNVNVIGQELVDLDTDKGRIRFKEINQTAIDGGYEGIMIKDPTAPYETKRSTAWLKQKPFIEVSLTVVDLEEGTGKNVGKLGALVCEGTDDGKRIRVNVGSGLSDDMRDDIWNDRASVVGQVVEIRADATTRNQDSEEVYSLRFPRFLRFRGFKVGEKI